MGNKSSKQKMKAAAEQRIDVGDQISVYKELITSATSLKHERLLILNYNIRMFTVYEFPSEIKPLIMEYLSFLMPDIFLFLKSKIKELSNDYKEEQIFRIGGNSEILEKGRKLFFYPGSFWKNDLIKMNDLIENAEFKLGVYEYTSLFKAFIRGISVNCFSHTKYGGILGGFELKDNFPKLYNFKKITTDPVQCANYLNNVLFVDDGKNNMHVCKVIYWWLIELLREVVKQEKFNKMSASNCAIVFGGSLITGLGGSDRETVNKYISHSQTIYKVIATSIRYKMQQY
eukprot:132955_1